MESRLEKIFGEVKSHYRPASQFDLRVSYYPYKGLSHTIRIKDRYIIAKISDKIKEAPDNILFSIGFILFDKLFRKKTRPDIRKLYRQYADDLYQNLDIEPKRRISKKYSAKGSYFNLYDVFEKVNKEYFNSDIQKPVVAWSLNKSKKRLGFYDHYRNLLVISSIFDARRVPDFVIEFIMYHEILHILIPVKKRNGRHQIHPPEFRIREKEFLHYENAQKWLKKKLWRYQF